ncbi:PEP/pyruvate-binding domain-containing protein, partial [Desulfosarcina cetonica]|uniref:PEP/pyruvate-binding domain-containing protein n=1 Tax=Desulfosarcina cetonica TaxID=90730 RepID=UPI001583C453
MKTTMSPWRRIMNWFRPGGAPIDEADANTLRIEFQSRYHQFKLLLNANNQALEIMTELEKALEGNTPFGMKFIRSRTMGAYTRVYQIVKHLQALAPEKYKALSSRLQAIHLELESQLNPYLETDAGGPWIIHFAMLDKHQADKAGMKMAGLADAANQLQIRIPDGFVITARAFRDFLAHNDLKTEIQRRIQRAEDEGPHRFYTISADIRGLVENAPLPEDLETAILSAYAELADRCKNEPHVAVRSSALNEDREGASFAGLYQSALNVSRDRLLETYRQIVAAAYSPAVLAYRFSRGLTETDTEMCVGVMEMIDAVSGGVLYSVNPMDIRDRTVTINSAWGLPKAVVDGTTATDLFRVDRSAALSISRREIALKEQKFVCFPTEGICRMDETGPDRTAPSLTDEQILALAAMAIRIEDYAGLPQDIEWALDPSGEIVLLQCRPLQVITPSSDAAPVVDTDLPAALYQGGTTASPGVGAGPVHRVLKDVDALSFPEGG